MNDLVVMWVLGMMWVFSGEQQACSLSRPLSSSTLFLSRFLTDLLSGLSWPPWHWDCMCARDPGSGRYTFVASTLLTEPSP